MKNWVGKWGNRSKSGGDLNTVALDRCLSISVIRSSDSFSKASMKVVYVSCFYFDKFMQ